MLSPEQLAARMLGLGGSEAAAALGLSPWKTALELYEEKRLGSPLPTLEMNDAMKWGVRLEPVVRQAYSDETGREVTVPNETIVHPEFRFMLATLDGRCDDRLYEGKTARNGIGWGEPGTDEIPQHYLIQVQHYMIVTGLRLADVAVLIGGSDFRIYTVEADVELQEMIVDGEHDFWTKVQAGTPPEIDFESPRALELVRRLYRGVERDQIVEASGLMQGYREIYFDAEARLKTYQALSDGAKAHLLYEMGAAAELKFPDGVVLKRKLVKRKGYVVPDTQYVDARFVNPKEE